MGRGWGGPTATKHDHVGEMVYEGSRCYCQGCGQKWWLKEEVKKDGSVLWKWIPTPEKQW